MKLGMVMQAFNPAWLLLFLILTLFEVKHSYRESAHSLACSHTPDTWHLLTGQPLPTLSLANALIGGAQVQMVKL